MIFQTTTNQFKLTLILKLKIRKALCGMRLTHMAIFGEIKFSWHRDGQLLSFTNKDGAFVMFNFRIKGFPRKCSKKHVDVTHNKLR